MDVEDQYVKVVISKDLLKRITDASAQLDINRSQFFRTAARRFLNDLDSGTAVMRLDPNA